MFRYFHLQNLHNTQNCSYFTKSSVEQTTTGVARERKWRRQVSEFGRGAFEGEHILLREQDRISRNTPPGIFSIHTQTEPRPFKIVSAYQNFSRTYQMFFLDLAKCNFLTTLWKFSQLCPSNTDFPKNIWPFFTKAAPLPMWFLQPWLSTTDDFYRNYQELDGGKMGTENNFVGHLPPPLALPLAPQLERGLGR